jgi:thioredoxin-like negative regulator of GroEL
VSVIKPFFISIVILLSLFAAGLMNAHAVANWSDEIAAQVEQSAAAAAEGDWVEVGRALAQAEEEWQAHEAYLHVMIDHSAIDDTEDLFAEVRSYEAQEDAEKYCTGAQKLSTQLSHLKETQQLSFKNIL